MTTLTDITQASASISGSGSVRFATASHASIRSNIGVSASPSRVSGGVTYRDGIASISGSGSLAATPTVRRSAAASVTSSSSLRLGDGATAYLASLTGLAADFAYASSSSSLAPLTSSSRDALVVPSYAAGGGYLPALYGLSYMLSGSVGEVTATMAPLVGMSSDHPYAASSTSLAPLIGLSNDGPGALQAVASSLVAAYDFMTAAQVLDESIDDDLELTAALSAGLVIDRTMDQSLTIAATLSAAGIFYSQIAEVLQIIAGVARYTDSVAWVVTANATDGNGGRLFSNSMYSQYEFNSLGRFNGRYYGAKDDGIYELVGDDDAGEPIIAEVLLPKDDFGAAQLKQIESVYAGMRCAGDIELTVKVDDGSEYVYIMPASEFLENVRAKVGKGLRARYWQLKFRNPDGGDFTIHTAEAFAETTSRRL